ncbi:MAG: AraC family transcriptional regulator [Bacteroidota bacterium]
MSIQPPFHNEVVFQNEGCVLFFRNVDTHLFSSEDSIRLDPDEALLLRCGTYLFDLFEQSNQDRVEVVAIHLYPDLLRDIYITELPTLIEKRADQKKVQIIRPKNVIEKYVESLDLYFNNPSLVNDELLLLKIKELIMLLIQTRNMASVLELITDLYATRTVSLRNVIELHLYSNLRLAQLAKLCNMSLSSFKRAFKKEFNDSPHNYILDKKLEKAEELLRLSILPISEVAFETGFEDPLYFSRLFKKRLGESPSAYREIHQLS